MARELRVIALAILLVSFTCFVALPKASAAATTKVYVDPPKIEDTGLIAGSKFNVSIKIEGIPPDQGLAGVSFTLRWDPAILNCTVIQEILFHNVTPEDHWDNIWSLKLKANNTDGSAEYAQTWQDTGLAVTDGYAPISGTGTYVIANFTLMVRATGKCPIHIEALKLGDLDANTVPADVFDGSFSNMGAPPAPEAALIYVDPAKIVNVSLATGTTFSLNIGIINASGVAGLEFKLNFNVTALQAQSVVRGSFIPPLATTQTTIDNVTGFVKYNVSLSTPLEGNGIIAVIEFQVAADNIKSTPLHISDVVLVDDASQALPFTTADGSFRNLALLLGDLNEDNVVDIYDALLAANAFGSKPGDGNWNPDADINGDGLVDIFDLILLAQNFGRRL